VATVLPNTKDQRPEVASEALADRSSSKSTGTVPQRPIRNAAARYDAIVKLIADCCCQHCAGLGWALREVDIELEQARELGRAGDQVLDGGNPQLRWLPFAEFVARRLTPRRWTR
jgi:hypothetical protein